METENYEMFLANDFNSSDINAILPLIQKCFCKGKSESTILRALEISFGKCLQCLSGDILEEQIFKHACPRAKEILVNKLKFLEDSSQVERNSVETNIEALNICTKLICYLKGIFEFLNDNEKFKLSQIRSCLSNCIEIIHLTVLHCKISEKLYESCFNALADYLSNFFKTSCDLLEVVLNFMSEKLVDYLEENEINAFNQILTNLAKIGILLINLEVKTMAKVWKFYTILIEKYFSFLKFEHNIGETINYLCSHITCDVEKIFSVNPQDNQNLFKIVKLNLFLLKLVIKFCESFKGLLKDCENSILKLFLALCKCKISVLEDKDTINQLVVGIDPFLAQIILNEAFVTECSVFTKNLSCYANKTPEFSFFCCLVCQKLMNSDAVMKNLWFNNSNNVINWLFECVSFSEENYVIFLRWNILKFCNFQLIIDFLHLGEFYMSSQKNLPKILIFGKQKQFTDLYEFVLVTMSSYLVTLSSADFYIAEKILINNIIQSNPLKALLASDIWCLLARFQNSDLCWDQVHKLCLIFENMKGKSIRLEKCYLKSLIQRLFPLLSENSKQMFYKLFQPSFYLELWGEDGTFSEINGFLPKEAYYINSLILIEVNKILLKNLPEDFQFQQSVAYKSSDCNFKKLSDGILQLWKFDPAVLSKCFQKNWILKTACSLAAYIIPKMPSESLILILQQLKKLILLGQVTAVKLYITWILNSFSTLQISSDQFEQNIVNTMAEIFRLMLSSEEIIVKQITLESFYFFSHFTSHSLIITLTVQNSSALKSEMVNYLKKKFPDELSYNLNEYMKQLSQENYQHICYERQHCNEVDMELIKSKSIESINLQEIIDRWIKDGETIKKYINLLTETQKNEIKTLITKIL